MEIMAARPVGMLESLVLTVMYRPDYRYENEALASGAPDPEVVVIPQIFVERFLELYDYRMGLEEYEAPAPFGENDEDDFFFNYVTDHKNWCPQIVNAMYVDMMGNMQIVDMRSTLAQFPSAFDMKR